MIIQWQFTRSQLSFRSKWIEADECNEALNKVAAQILGKSSHKTVVAKVTQYVELKEEQLNSLLHVFGSGKPPRN